MIAIGMLLDEIFEDDGPADVEKMLPALAVSRWPHRIDRPLIHVDALLRGGVEYMAQHADEPTYEKMTRLNKISFDCLLRTFLDKWNHSITIGASEYGRESSRLLSCRGCLFLVLHWLAHGPPLTSLIVFVGASASTTSRYLNAGLRNLYDGLKKILEASLEIPSEEYEGNWEKSRGNIRASHGWMLYCYRRVVTSSRKRWKCPRQFLLRCIPPRL